MVAQALGTLNSNGEPRTQVTANALGWEQKGTQRIRDLMRNEGDRRRGTLHWDEAWQFYIVLGWINEAAVQAARRAAARNQARRAAESARAANERHRRGGR